MTDASQQDNAARLAATMDEAALACAMSIVPTLYSRNRFFKLMSDPRMRRARRRAISLRTAIRQIAGGGAANVTLEARGHFFRLTYELPRLAYVRKLDLTNLERATVAFLLEKAGSTAIPCSAEDRALVERTVSCLTEPVEAEAELASLAAGDR